MGVTKAGQTNDEHDEQRNEHAPLGATGRNKGGDR